MYTLLNYFNIFDRNILNVFKYITVRSGMSFLLSFLYVLYLMPYFIKLAIKINPNGQPIRKENGHILAPDHNHKIGTPTLGGLVVLESLLLNTILFCDLTNQLIHILIFTAISFGTIGLIDDIKKIRKKNHGGITAKQKLLFQIVFSFIIIMWTNYLFTNNGSIPNNYYTSYLIFPFFKDFILNLGIFYTILRILVISGTSNAINITDGLDGLISIPIVFAVFTLGTFSYILGSPQYAKYLLFEPLNGVAEICIFLSAIAGGMLGFLWHNAKPAKIFIGDCGSLSLGGIIGTVAIIIKSEILLIILGGLFVIETLSVTLQVLSFKTRRKRIFLMAPLHHHFEKKGWSETQIVVRFWIISILFCIIALSSLKIR